MIPYCAIASSSVLTANPIDLDADLTVWIVGSSILEVQTAPATCVGR